MNLASEILGRLLRVIYWGLWVAEIGVAAAVLRMLDLLVSNNLTDEGLITLIIAPIVAILTHYVLIIPISKKLTKDKADA
jgi:uncharacterized membrane protein YhaH (DUF805 family)